MSAASPLDAPIVVTFFKNFTAQEKREENYTPRALAERIRAVTAPKKAALPWLKAARFGDDRTGEHCLRHDDNVIACSGIEADYDGEQMAFDTACELLEKQGIAAIVYTSPSHTDAAPRWRVVCPLSVETPPERRQHMLGRLNGLFRGIFSGESWTLSQSYYYGSVKHNPAHRVEVIDGTCIDLHDDLDRTWIGKPNTGPKTNGSTGPQSGPVDIDALTREILEARNYHQAMIRIAGRLAADGMSMLQVRQRLRDAMESIPLNSRDDRWKKRYADIGRTLEYVFGKEAGKSNGVDDAPEAASELPIEFSENALAYQFTAEHAGDLLFVHEWGKWLRWDAGRWREDFTVTVFDAARVITARAGDKAIATIPRAGKKIATAINKASTIAAIERLCRHHHKHVRSDSVFDADRRVMNTPDSEISMHDIATRRPHRREDYMTRMTNVSAAPKGTACPIWSGFLMKIMGDDPVMVKYLQRVCGYMLTGSVQEHVLFFGYGTGANGKSTFASVLLGILGSGTNGYAAVAPISTFTAMKNEQHPTDLAMLRGVRCVIAQETEEGRSWAVSKLKMMTGGDPITARFMRQDFFTYDPQFKLLILGNHKPALHGIDEAWRRRIHLIPFTVTIPAPERDPELGEKLKAEYPAILAWMIEGCVAWQKEGLNPPKQVVEATRKYLVDEDALASWMGEACLVDRKYSSTPLIELFASWKAWAEANGERVGQRKELAKALDTRPELTRHDQPGTGRAAWNGIVVKPPSVTGGAAP